MSVFGSVFDWGMVVWLGWVVWIVVMARLGDGDGCDGWVKMFGWW